ncbi:unnamed protein product [Prorocentrum cordatum]|uniref:Uncharacterized protein n=1 Tax=Prorocentrum cordatum TaxID=2364126 RepID=A0ABN9TTA2_9DINO|nr:unnamed protein product [Polarella glacialis]
MLMVAFRQKLLLWWVQKEVCILRRPIAPLTTAIDFCTSGYLRTERPGNTHAAAYVLCVFLVRFSVFPPRSLGVTWLVALPGPSCDRLDPLPTLARASTPDLPFSSGCWPCCEGAPGECGCEDGWELAWRQRGGRADWDAESLEADQRHDDDEDDEEAGGEGEEDE